jgi:hypothetical protein
LPYICTLSSTSLQENKQKPENAGIKIKKQNKNDKIFYHCRNLALLSSTFAAKLEKGRKKREKTVVIKPIIKPN